MSQTEDERYVLDLFRPVIEESDRLFREFPCPSATRIWRVASGSSEWDPQEQRHLAVCEKCRARVRQIRDAIAQAASISPGPTSLSPSASFAVPTIALGNGLTPQPARTSAQLWHLDASRRSAAADGFADSGADERTEVAVLRREDGTVQIKLDGFLLPQPGESVRVEVRSGDGTDLLGSARLPDGDDVINLDDLPRPIQDGDRLQIIRRDESTGAKLEIELEIRTT